MMWPQPPGYPACARAGVCIDSADTVATDDKHARGLRLLLLGRRAVLAHRFERSLTAEMDD